MANEADTKAEIARFESEIAAVLADDSGADMVARTVKLKGLEELLFSAKAKYARETNNDKDAVIWWRASKEAAELKTKAARALAADEAREAIEAEEFDAETRRMGLALIK